MNAVARGKDYDAAKLFKQEINSLLLGNGAQAKVEPSEPVSSGPAEVQSSVSTWPGQ